MSGGLEDTRVLVGERTVPIDAPPLSYGQLHTALLSIRMGAADFLAGLGVRLPLLIDDPFVHLDERSAGELWRILIRIGRERQVIVATQDRLLLDHLGIAPDLVLADAAPGISPEGPDETEAQDGRTRATPLQESALSDGTPDLWGHLEP